LRTTWEALAVAGNLPSDSDVSDSSAGHGICQSASSKAS